jgi:hypothetical protein
MNALKKIFFRPPFIGLLGFVVVLIVQALGHTVMILMENVFGEEYMYQSATAMGILGAVLLYIGMKHPKEVSGTWLGFFAGTFLWTGWVEFSFVWNATWLGVADGIDPVTGDISTKGEYFVMMSSLGIMMATLVYFTLNKETKCNFFHWIQRRMYLNTGKPTRGYPRNFAAITALETIYVVWFCYLMLLFIYEILGDTSPWAYALFFFNTIWAIFLLNRLIKFWKVTTAIRYAIPTAIITWNTIELLGRWNLFEEIWIHPEKYWLEMGMVFGAFVIVIGISMLTPKDAKKTFEQEQGKFEQEQGTV